MQACPSHTVNCWDYEFGIEINTKVTAFTIFFSRQAEIAQRKLKIATELFALTWF
jgi:hypothetical protein